MPVNSEITLKFIHTEAITMRKKHPFPCPCKKYDECKSWEEQKEACTRCSYLTGVYKCDFVAFIKNDLCITKYNMHRNKKP